MSTDSEITKRFLASNSVLDAGRTALVVAQSTAGTDVLELLEATPIYVISSLAELQQAFAQSERSNTDRFAIDLRELVPEDCALFASSLSASRTQVGVIYLLTESQLSLFATDCFATILRA